MPPTDKLSEALALARDEVEMAERAGGIDECVSVRLARALLALSAPASSALPQERRVLGDVLKERFAAEQTGLWKFAQHVAAITSGKVHGLATAVCMGLTWDEAHDYCREIGASEQSEFLSAPSASGMQEVWLVENKSSRVILASEDDAKAYVSQLLVSVSGGMFITRVPVLRAKADRGNASG